MQADEEVDEHWLTKVRNFSENVIHEMRDTQNQLRGVDLELDFPPPSDDKITSAWVDGGSAYLDLVGGSLYVIRAAAGLFRPNESIKWYERMDAGFTSLPRNVDRFVGIERDILEIECILELLNNNPEFAVLDNGLASYATQGVPHSSLYYFTHPQPDDSPHYEYFRSYMRFLQRFDILIQQCQTLEVPLIGAAKDPRSRLLSREYNFPRKLNDSATLALYAGGRTGFTPVMDAKYLEIPRVKQFLESKSILIDGRADFQTMFGIMKPHGRVFRLDTLRSQENRLDEVKGFAVSMHDGNGYLLPSHIVHNRAMIPDALSESLARLIMSSIAKEDMNTAKFVFGAQRRSMFG